MNPTEPSNSDKTLEHSVFTTIHRQQRRLTFLTWAAIGLWSLAVIGSACVLVFYTVFYAPKEKHMLDNYMAKTVLTVPTRSVDRMPGGTPQDAETIHVLQQSLGAHMHLSYVVTRGVLIVAGALLILACGTLVTLALIVFSRRATLHQLQHGLAQIAEQLQRLQPGDA
jgi:hypothetical protein